MAQEKVLSADEWCPMKKAPAQLGISEYKLTRLLDRYQISTKRSAFDKRIWLINLNEVRAILAQVQGQRADEGVRA